MGADLFESSPYFRSLIEMASDLTKADLKKACLRGPERVLIRPNLLQPLLTCLCLGYHRALAEAGVRADVYLGHSLGEITSLAAAGILSEEDAVKVAARRGGLMEEVASRVDGGMVAALFVPLHRVIELLQELRAPDRIVLANDNAPEQVVVSGDRDMLERFVTAVHGEPLGKCKNIRVAGPWHSPYMNEVRAVFEHWVKEIPFHAPAVPLVFNALCREETDPERIRALVTWQLVRPVYWRESMDRLKQMGVNTLLEVGPGRVLAGLARVNGFRKGVQVYTVNNLRGVQLAAEGVGEH